MGTCSSSQGAQTPGPMDMPSFGNSNNILSMDTNEKSPQNLYDSRGPRSFPIVGERLSFQMTYCAASQRGFYPDALDKANQDSFLISESLMGDSNCHLFGVFDGHGSLGDLCSYFCAQNFKKHLATQIQGSFTSQQHSSISRPTDVLKNEILLEDVFKSSFNSTNKELRDSAIDDSLSGTTGIAVLVHGDVVHVGNVGDSRAVLASFDPKTHKLRFSPLSNDQTPFRKDERARLRKCGAKIMSVDQIDEDQKEHDMWGEDGFESEDPPRVWDHSLQMPGCGFTRSLGDTVGESVGVCSDPEVLSWKLTPEDKYVILASDGIFEFLSSQIVIDMVNKVLNQTKSPVEAIKFVISEAFRLWVAHDERTDDITMMLICLDHFKVSDQVGITGVQKQRKKDSSNEEVNKRLKAVLPTEKSLDMKKNWRKLEGKFDFKKGEVKKSRQESDWLAYAMSTSRMLDSLSYQQKMNMTMIARKVNVTANKVILEEEQEVDNLYIIESGEYAVFQKDSHGINRRVTTLTSPGAVFGDIPLAYGYGSDVKVVAMIPGSIWTVGKKGYRAIITGNKVGKLSDKDQNNIVTTLSN